MELFPNFRDFPTPGFDFPDITHILERRPKLFSNLVCFVKNVCVARAPDAIISIDSFGHLFAAPVAAMLGKRLVLARRTGKLPDATSRQPYNMCYAVGRTIEIHRRSIDSDDSILIVDDFLASGGTASAVVRAARELGATTISAVFVAELVEFGGRQRLENCDTAAIDAALSLSFDRVAATWTVVEARVPLERESTEPC